MVTITDSDRAGEVIHDIERTELVVQHGLGHWRVPYTWFALDIEYVTWANPKSEILYYEPPPMSGNTRMDLDSSEECRFSIIQEDDFEKAI